MQIIWSDLAVKNLKGIFDYYTTKLNRKIAQKIRREILASTKQLIHNPESGQIEFYLGKLKQNHRYLFSGNYKIIYRIENDKIFINDVFDVRQNPDKMIDNSKNNS